MVKFYPHSATRLSSSLEQFLNGVVGVYKSSVAAPLCWHSVRLNFRRRLNFLGQNLHTFVVFCLCIVKKNLDPNKVLNLQKKYVKMCV